MYAGASLISGRAAIDDLWILSLPGFTWHRVRYEPEHPRVGHTCVAASNRQLLSVGGFDSNLGNPRWWRTKDHFPQGLGVFDMTELAWKDGYDADAEPYESPAEIRAWYEDKSVRDVCLM